MFCDLLYCADCGSKLWSHVNTVNKNIQYFSCSNYKTDTRGTCETRHYIRADAIEQVVMLELRRMAQFLQDDEEVFAELLAQKTNKDILKEQKYLEEELCKSVARNEKISGLYEKLYEDNASGKVTDEWFMQLSHKYEVERMELKAKIAKLRKRISNIGTMQQNKENFINAILVRLGEPYFQSSKNHTRIQLYSALRTVFALCKKPRDIECISLSHPC